MTGLYKIADQKLAWRGKESSIGVILTRDQDAVNEATDTFWNFPLELDQDTQVRIIPLQKQFRGVSVISSRYQKQRWNKYEAGILEISGAVKDHRIVMYYGTDECVTTDNSPAGYNTHVHTTANALAAVSPSFQILAQLVSQDSNETKTMLFTGCILVDYRERMNWESGVLIGTMKIQFRRAVAGVNLTDPGWPAINQKADFTASFTITLSKGAHNYVYDLVEYEYHFYTDKRLVQTLDYYPPSIRGANAIIHSIKLRVFPKETDLWDDSNDEPQTAQAKTCTVKYGRDSTNDYFQVAIAKAFAKLIGSSMAQGVLVQHYEFLYNPEEASSSVILTEVNDEPDDEYEDGVS